MTDAFSEVFSTPATNFLAMVNKPILSNPIANGTSGTLYSLTKDTLNHNDIFFYFFNTLNTNNFFFTKR